MSKNVPLSKLTGNSNPVIMLIASYDALTPIPDQQLGVKEFSTGIIGLFNVAKYLKSIADNYDQPE